MEGGETGRGGGQGCSGQGQLDDEGAALAGFALDADAAFVERHHLRDVAESYAEAFDVVDVAGVDAVEFFENMLLVLFRDANAIVFHAQHGPLALLAGADDEVGLAGGVLDGVVHQVVHHVGYVQLVGVEGAGDGL